LNKSDLHYKRVKYKVGELMMRIFEKFVSYIIIFATICITFIGCSKLSITSDSRSLDSWVGYYTFIEFYPPDQSIAYGIQICKEKNNYYAEIGILGFQTQNSLLAKVSGDNNSIKLVFEKYLPENGLELYKQGDILLSFEKKDTKLITSWSKIGPMIESNKKSGENYFEIEP
jgi:hypothetical protein